MVVINPDAIKTLRVKNHWAQWQVARAVQCSKSRIADLEQGLKLGIHVDLAWRLAALFKCQIEDLLMEDGAPKIDFKTSTHPGKRASLRPAHRRRPMPKKNRYVPGKGVFNVDTLFREKALALMLGDNPFEDKPDELCL